MVKIPDNASFTGSDIKAMVYMPINMTALNNEINELQEQLNELYNRSSEALSSEDITGYHHIAASMKFLNSRIADLQQIKSSGGKVLATVLAELSTISYSIHRETFPVRTLGSVYAKDYTRGPRTIAGSLVFTVFNKHVLANLLEATGNIVSSGVSSPPDEYNSISPVLPDQIPPFDIVITYNNELGESAGMIIYGVQIVNEGQVTSVNDMITENQMQFVARDIDIMRDVSTRNLVRNMGIGKAKTPRDLSKNDDNFQRLRRRHNPFI